MPKRKCVICEQIIEDNADSVPYKNRYAHKHCFNIAMKTITQQKTESLKQDAESKKKKTAKPKAELKDAVSEEEYKQKRDFYQYIRSYFEDENGDLPVKTYAVAERQIQQYGYTFLQMKLTLIFIREIREIEIQGDGVGLIPYYYDEAMNYYKSLKKVAETNKGINVKGMYQKKVIVINPLSHKNKPQLDITTIRVEGEQ